MVVWQASHWFSSLIQESLDSLEIANVEWTNIYLKVSFNYLNAKIECYCLCAWMFDFNAYLFDHWNVITYLN